MNTKLSCIMFTDIFGFSQMMETSESDTLGVLEHHNSLVFPLVKTFGGVVVEAVGDGLLVLFDSALSAVNCGVTIQKAVERATSELPENRQFKMRIGLHLGDIWYDENRVYGNGVNIASRIESQALPGGVCISEDMYHQVANKISLEFRSLGVVPLKNIERPIRLYHIVTGFETSQPEPKLVAQDDERRQKLLAARDKVRTNLELSRQGPETPGSAIDKAMVESSKGIVTLTLNNPLKRSKRRGKNPKGFRNLFPLATLLAGFGTGIFYFGYGWMWIPFTLFGIGFVSRLGKMVAERLRFKKEGSELPR